MFHAELLVVVRFREEAGNSRLVLSLCSMRELQAIVLLRANCLPVTKTGGTTLLRRRDAIFDVLGLYWEIPLFLSVLEGRLVVWLLSEQCDVIIMKRR